MKVGQSSSACECLGVCSMPKTLKPTFYCNQLGYKIKQFPKVVII